MFVATFALTSPVYHGEDDQEVFFFFVEKDGIILIDGIVQDSASSAHQKSLFLSTPGQLQCADRKDPPVAPNFIYYQRCIKLISRTIDSFVLDYTSRAILRSYSGGGNEVLRQGRLSVRIHGDTCQAQLISPARSYANRGTTLVPFNAIQHQECIPVRPPS